MFAEIFVLVDLHAQIRTKRRVSGINSMVLFPISVTQTISKTGNHYQPCGSPDHVGHSRACLLVSTTAKLGHAGIGAESCRLAT